MDSKEKIIELLAKKQLSDEEKLQLETLLKNDHDAEEFYKTHKKLGCTLKSKHISSDDLGNYILFKNNNEPEDKNFIERIPQIELHLKSCSQCTEEFKILNEEFSDVDLYLTDKFKTIGINSHKEKSDITRQQRTSKVPLYAFSSLVVIGFLYIILLVVSNISTPNIYQLASISDESEFYTTRGRSTDEFQQSLKALEEKNFDKAIKFLESDISNNSNDQTIFYTHYILGLTYLEKAEKSFAGLFKSFDDEDAAKGLKNLQLCIEKNTSGRFPDITNNAYFYSAKASLMMDNTESAKKYLSILIDQKGSKMNEAQRLLNELE